MRVYVFTEYDGTVRVFINEQSALREARPNDRDVIEVVVE